MAGYVGHSKSRNAVFAEKQGKFPVSVCAKKARVPTELIRQFIEPCEWHHTSKWYNETDYFDLEEVEITFGRKPPNGEDDYQPVPEAIQALADYRQRARTAEPQVFDNCKVEWLEWSGMRSWSVSKRRVAYDCTVSVKGVTATITFADGKTMVKRLATRGFAYSRDKNQDAERADVERKRQRELEKASKASERQKKTVARYQAELARREEILPQMVAELMPAVLGDRYHRVKVEAVDTAMRKHMPGLMSVGSKKARSTTRKLIRAAISRELAAQQSAKT